MLPIGNMALPIVNMTLTIYTARGCEQESFERRWGPLIIVNMDRIGRQKCQTSLALRKRHKCD